MYRDTDFNPRSEEELREEERERELQRRIRREVRRIQSGEADEEMAEERAREGGRSRRDGRPAGPRTPPGGQSVPGLLTGNVLRQEWLVGHYRYPLLIAGTFLLSIVVMFWALRLDMTHTRTEREGGAAARKGGPPSGAAEPPDDPLGRRRGAAPEKHPLHDPVVPGEIIEE